MLGSIKNRFQLKFKDRVIAAKILSAALEDSLRKMKIDKKNSTILILGIPRGGAIVADVIISTLPYHCEFDLIIPKKLTSPYNEELAIGAIMEDGTTYLNYELINELKIDEEYIEHEKANRKGEIKERKQLYRNSKELTNVHGRIVILVDDGVASGSTILVAARSLKKYTPSKLVIATPIAPKTTFNELRKECNAIVTGITPSKSVFQTVSQYYHDFKPIDDDRVIEICKRRNLLPN